MRQELKAIRENIGLTQEQVSKIIGVPVKTLRNWEQGIRKPSEWVFNLFVEKLLKIELEEQLRTDDLSEISIDEMILINLNYHKWINNIPVGYSSHKLILDDDGKAYNYNFVNVNNLFEEYTGLKAKDVIGKSVLDVLPDIVKGDFDWISYYADIALNDKTGEFIAYSEPLKKKYMCKVFSPEYLYFVVFFSEYKGD